MSDDMNDMISAPKDIEAIAAERDTLARQVKRMQMAARADAQLIEDLLEELLTSEAEPDIAGDHVHRMARLLQRQARMAQGSPFGDPFSGGGEAEVQQ